MAAMQPVAISTASNCRAHFGELHLAFTVADADAGLEFDAEPQGVVQFDGQNVARQAELRDP